MVRDAVRTYLVMAAGVGSLTQQRALAAAKSLMSSGEATAEQVTGLADDLLATSRANRDLVTGLVKTEVDRAIGRLGLATAEEIRLLTARLSSLEAILRDARNTPPTGGAPARPPPPATTARSTTPAARPGAAKPGAAKPGAAKPAVAKTSRTAVRAATGSKAGKPLRAVPAAKRSTAANAARPSKARP